MNDGRFHLHVGDDHQTRGRFGDTHAFTNRTWYLSLPGPNLTTDATHAHTRSLRYVLHIPSHIICNIDSAVLCYI